MSELQAVPAVLETEIARIDLAPDSVAVLRDAYGPHFADFLAVEETANAVPQTAPDLARAVRLKLKQIRVAAEKTRKTLKEDSLRRGQAIDGVNRLLLARLAPLEERMRDIEEREERERQAHFAALQAAREEALAPFVAFATPAEVVGLPAMSEDQFGALLARCETADAAEKAEIARAEAARLQAEAEAAAERERLRVENERLAREAAEERRQRAEAEAEAERARAAERRARQEAEAEQARRQEEARQAEEARVAAERAAAAAPDAEKLRAFAVTLRTLPLPECETEAACVIVDDICHRAEQFAWWVESKAKSLEGTA